MWGVVVALVVVIITLWFYRWANPKCSSGKLPPGSMGLPVIGETIEFFKPHSFYETPPFIKKRMSRYGSLFRTSILGSKTIVSTDPDVNFEIFRQENRCFVMSYPELLVRILGKDNLFFKQGMEFHKYVRHISQQLLGPECLKKQRFMHEINRTTHEQLRTDSSRGVLEVKDTAARLILEHMIQKIISDIKAETKSKILLNLTTFSFVALRSPFDPSSWKDLYHCLLARRNVTKMMKDMFRQRREKASSRYGDFMEILVDEVEKEGDTMNEERAVELIINLLIGSNETTSTIIGLAVKFIAENPKVLTELKREHETILQNKDDKDCGITWKEYKSMIPFTHMVINESLRLGTLAPFMFRKVVSDVEIKGYTVPAGWIVVVAPSVVHYDPQIYENPCEFNPWRWEGKELLTGSKTFMAFGGGARLCAGAEFARLQTAIFLHHLVTKYDFSLIEKHDDIIRAPVVCFSKSICISIFGSHPVSE